MSKGVVAVIALALAMLPARAAGQDVGVSFRILRAAPVLGVTVDDQTGGTARAPEGWAVAVSRGTGGGAGSRYAPATLRGRTRQIPLLDESADPAVARGVDVVRDEDATAAPVAEMVTVIYAPL